jgi:hypothetical protein
MDIVERRGEAHVPAVKRLCSNAGTFANFTVSVSPYINTILLGSFTDLNPINREDNNGLKEAITIIRLTIAGNAYYPLSANMIRTIAYDGDTIFREGNNPNPSLSLVGLA